MKKHSVLVAGLGQIGMGYDLRLDPASHVYSHARAFSLHPGFDLVAAFDPDESRREVFEREYRLPAHASLAEALERHHPDVMVIAAPTAVHADILNRALEYPTVKAILCEKPLSYDMDEARAMVRACSEKKVSLYVNYMRRSSPGAIEIGRRIDAGEIGAPIKGVAWYSKGFLHNGSHFFNLIEGWLGEAKGWKTIDTGRQLSGADSEPDVRVQFERGSVVFLAAREEAFSHYTVELLASNGRLRYEQGGKLVQWQPARRDAVLEGYTYLSPDAEIVESGMDRYQWHVAEQLARALDGKEAHLCTGAEALRTLGNMNKILERMES